MHHIMDAPDDDIGYIFITSVCSSLNFLRVSLLCTYNTRIDVYEHGICTGIHCAINAFHFAFQYALTEVHTKHRHTTTISHTSA